MDLRKLLEQKSVVCPHCGNILYSQFDFKGIAEFVVQQFAGESPEPAGSALVDQLQDLIDEYSETYSLQQSTVELLLARAIKAHSVRKALDRIMQSAAESS